MERIENDDTDGLPQDAEFLASSLNLSDKEARHKIRRMLLGEELSDEDEDEPVIDIGEPFEHEGVRYVAHPCKVCGEVLLWSRVDDKGRFSFHEPPDGRETPQGVFRDTRWLRHLRDLHLPEALKRERELAEGSAKEEEEHR